MAFGAKDKTEQARLEEELGMYISELSMEMLTNPDYPDNGVIQLEDLPLEFEGKQPKLGWVNVENNIVTEYEFYFENEYILKTENEFRVREYSNLINVKDFGAVGDGVTDDTAAIKSAVASLNENGGILYFPTGTYVVSVASNSEDIITLNSDKEIELDFFKSTMQMTTNGYPNYNIVNAKNCTNVEVRNGKLVGDRLTHDYVTTDSSHCWGMGVRSTNNELCNILNMEISEMTGDAVTTSNSSTGTTNINDCNLHHCRRMGITIVESDVVNVNNTNIQYIGTFDNITGVNPMSGINIEPSAEDATINYVSINNANIDNTTSYGVINVSENALKIDINNSKIEYLYINQNANITNSELTYKTTRTGSIRNSVIKDSYIYKNESDFALENTIVDNCTFESNDISNGQHDVSARMAFVNATVTNSTFKNWQGKGDYASNSVAQFGVLLSTGYSLTDGSSNNVYDGCAIIMDGFTDSNSEIKNSYIYKRNKNVTFDSIDLENCEIKAHSKPLTFNNCSIKNCSIWRQNGAGGTLEIYYNNSNMICDSITSPDYFYINSFFDASTINVLGEVTKSAFSNVTLSNASKIILDRYSSVNLDIPKSNLGTDYTIECNGTEVIE